MYFNSKIYYTNKHGKFRNKNKMYNEKIWNNCK